MYVVREINKEVKQFIIYNIDGFGDMTFVAALHDKDRAYDIVDILRADEAEHNEKVGK